MCLDGLDVTFGLHYLNYDYTITAVLVGRKNTNTPDRCSVDGWPMLERTCDAREFVRHSNS